LAYRGNFDDADLPVRIGTEILRVVIERGPHGSREPFHVERVGRVVEKLDDHALPRFAVPARSSSPETGAAAPRSLPPSHRFQRQVLQPLVIPELTSVEFRRIIGSRLRTGLVTFASRTGEVIQVG